MLAAIQAAILYLVTVPGIHGATYAPHFAHAPGGPQFRAHAYAEMIVQASEDQHLDPYLYTALLSRESAFDPQARSPRGAFGLAQLHPRFWGHDLIKKCNASPSLCTWWSVARGAVALNHYVRMCGSEARAVAAYRLGHCAAAGPETRKVLVVRRVIAHKFRTTLGVHVGEVVIL